MDKDRQSRAASVKQTLASWALEGFVPDAAYVALLDQYIAGTIEIDALSAVVNALCRQQEAGADAPDP